MFEAGKLYKTNEYSLLVYPTIESAAEASVAITSAPDLVKWSLPPATKSAPGTRSPWVEYWSRIYHRKIYYSDLGEIFMFLEQDGNLLHVLFGAVVGWIVYRDWLHIEEALNGI